jgi:hypothetical protein
MTRGSKALSRRALSVDIYREAIIAIMWSGKTRPAGVLRLAGSLAEAKNYQTQKFAELERHREGSVNLDDREILSAFPRPYLGK